MAAMAAVAIAMAAVATAMAVMGAVATNMAHGPWWWPRRPRIFVEQSEHNETKRLVDGRAHRPNALIFV